MWLDNYKKGKRSITVPFLLIVLLLSSCTFLLSFKNQIRYFGLSSSWNEFHQPNVQELEHLNVHFYDLKDSTINPDGWNHNEKVLFLVPLRDASSHIAMFVENLKNITYPHHLIDLAFLVSDTTDSTIKDLKAALLKVQKHPDVNLHFGEINIYEKNFGQIIGQSFSDRHGFAAQGPRRKLMAIARNWLLATAIKPEYSWVYWRDADVETVPPTIIEDLMHHNKDVIVPNIWRPLPDWLGNEQPYDLNSWQESEAGLDLANRLDEDDVIVEGYQEYKTWRLHLAYLRDPFGDPEIEMELDGIGGVSILSKGKVFLSGAMFPAFSYLKHAETEGFGKLCKTMNFEVIGLPNYVIWHIYEPSVQDLQHMKWMAEEKKNKFKKAKSKKLYTKKWSESFVEVDKDWEILKFNVFKNTDLKRDIHLEWNDVDGYLKSRGKPDNEFLNEDFFIDNEAPAEPLSGDELKIGYIPSYEIFGSFPLTNEAKRDSFMFVNFDENDQKDTNHDGDGNKDSNDDDINVKNSDMEDGDIDHLEAMKQIEDLHEIEKNDGEEKRLEQELERLNRLADERKRKFHLKPSQNDNNKKNNDESTTDDNDQDSENNLELNKVKFEQEIKQNELELQHIKDLYEQKKKENEEKKLQQELERLTFLADERKRKKLQKKKDKLFNEQKRIQDAIDKEIARKKKLYN